MGVFPKRSSFGRVARREFKPKRRGFEVTREERRRDGCSTIDLLLLLFVFIIILVIQITIEVRTPSSLKLCLENILHVDG